METTTSAIAAQGVRDVESATDGAGDSSEAVLRCLSRIVPSVDVEDLDRTAAIQDEADLDSLDFVHLMVAIADETGVDVPERDYPFVATLDDLVAYVGRRAGAT